MKGWLMDKEWCKDWSWWQMCRNGSVSLKFFAVSLGESCILDVFSCGLSARYIVRDHPNCNSSTAHLCAKETIVHTESVRENILHASFPFLSPFLFSRLPCCVPTPGSSQRNTFDRTLPEKNCAWILSEWFHCRAWWWRRLVADEWHGKYNQKGIIDPLDGVSR